MQLTKLADKVILVKLTQRRAALTRTSKNLSEAIQQQFNDSSLKAMYRLFQDKSSPVRKLMSQHNEVYQYHKKETLPYVDAGPRMLPSTLYFEFGQELRHRIAVVDKSLAAITPIYDQLVANDIMYRTSGGQSSVTVDEYPDVATFAQSVSSDIRFTPMPNKRHFLFDLSEEDEKAFDDAEQQALQMANEDVINRMLAPLTALTKRLGEYKGEKGERFHTSLMENILDGCKTARKLAIDPSDELLKEITGLEDIAARYLGAVEIIKASPDAREQARKRLEEATERMSAYF
jgi:hypothetical protein